MSLGHGSSIVRDGLVLHLDAANKKSYPGTGTTISNLQPENIPQLITGDGFKYISDNNAAELGYTAGPSDVKGASNPTGACSGLMTFEDAVELVHSMGARLPTVDEVRRGVAVGSGCNYDNLLIWTADAANAEGTEHYVIFGRVETKGSDIYPRDVNSTAFVRYVADVNNNRTDPAPIISNNLRDILENYYSVTYETLPSSLIGDVEDKSNISLRNGVVIGSNYFEFDGTNDYISTGKSFLRNPDDFSSGNSSYTLEAWIYPTAYPSGELLSGSSIIGHASSDGFGMQLNYTSNKLLINFGARSTDNFNSVSHLNLNNWYHIVCAREVGVENKIYINGVKDSTYTISALTVNETLSEIQIGYAASRISSYFNGKIGLVRAYKKSLSDQEIQQNFEASRRRYGI